MAVAACLALSMSTACQTGPSVTAGRQYTCCQGHDPEVPYRSGDTVTLRWTVRTFGTPSGPPETELTARLTGPYQDTAALKATADARTITGDVTVTAEPVRPTGAPGEEPTSVLRIGTDVPAGHYNLVWSARDSRGGLSGASVVEVVAAP
ncbi:hypothetical protein Pen02_78610 [Plantactinospora endophytica]|uniref:Copper resistance protein CopC n=1 Tax=Plantactinospora endophytica TaxID=673535 RepID=A0ABQ4EDY3_9ACTN|nr:hypothetical protein Pen02_78610 [Plantactinospora endophytica]